MGLLYTLVETTLPDLGSGDGDQGTHDVILYSKPGLRGLELWHGITREVPLHQLRDSKREYFQGLREFLVRLHQGEATAAEERDTLALQCAAGFTDVVLAGGDATHPALENILCVRPLPFGVEIAPGGIYAGRQGALVIFDELGWRNAIALDLGQLQLKVITRNGERCIPRDPEVLPFGARTVEETTARSRLRDMLRQGLRYAAELSTGPPEGVVLALPVELDAQGVARPATYPGLFGPVEPIFSSVFEMPWVVLNDAVLTARGFPPPAGRKRLVVTLGFGIGGALWETLPLH
jgi:hypothetical protein